MGSCDEILLALLYDEVVHRNSRKRLAVEFHPMFAAIDRDIRCALSADVEHVGIEDIFAHDLDRSRGWQITQERRPMLTAVSSYQKDWLEVIGAMAVGGDIRRPQLVTHRTEFRER